MIVVGENSGKTNLTQLFIDMSDGSATCLGCKRSLVQIQSRRPSYLFRITRQYEFSESAEALRSSLDKRQYTTVKDMSTRGKFGKSPDSEIADMRDRAPP